MIAQGHLCDSLLYAWYQAGRQWQSSLDKLPQKELADEVGDSMPQQALRQAWERDRPGSQWVRPGGFVRPPSPRRLQASFSRT